jgi:ABC-type dipeptide/oligopeptide/nickel transport system permease component
MASLFRTLFFWTLAIATSVIAVANRGKVPLSFDPFNSAAPAILFQVPLFWIVLVSALVGLVLGGWSSWLAQAPLRQAQRENEDKIRRLEREIEVAQKIIIKPSESRALDLRPV